MTKQSLTPQQERELKAMEAGAEGRPVEADLTAFATLAADLAETRPEPDPEFADRLDRAVADSFPAGWADSDETEGDIGRQTGSWTDRLRRRFGSGRRLALPAVAGLAGILLVATVVVSISENSQDPVAPMATKQLASKPFAAASKAESAADTGAAVTDGIYSESDERAPRPSPREAQAGALASPNLGPKVRKVAASARITLGTDPDGVQEVANEIVAVTDEHHGIVMDSSVTDGPAGKAGARFKLSIPSGQVESAIAALSEIADLRARTQETEDITAPYETIADRLATTRARIKSLLTELETAVTEEDRTRIENRLRNQRWAARYLQQRINRMNNRVTMTPIAVSVVTNEKSEWDDSGWGISDAFDDAGRLLGIAAGVSLVALAIAIPIGIMVLIALAINRAWVKRARRRALGERDEN